MPDPERFSIMVVDDIDINIEIVVDLLGGEYDIRVAMDGQRFFPCPAG